MPSERNRCTHAIRLRRPHVGAIARRGGGRDDQEDDLFGRTIAEAVFKVRRYMNALTGSEGDRVIGEFERRGACEHIEELACARMKVSDLSGTRRHTLLNDAKIRALQKVPTVADGTPGVMFGARLINRHQFSGHFGLLLAWLLQVLRGHGPLLDRTFSRLGQDLPRRATLNTFDES
jgi:hypothetical protein